MNEENVCCPQFDPALWDGKTFEWDKRKFVRGRVRTFFYMPLNFGAVMRRIQEKIRKSGAAVADDMWLADHTSKWNMDLYVAVDKEVLGAENVALSGTFVSKVYEGNFKETSAWMKDFEKYAREKNFPVGKVYMWYTTCPKCAKKYGNNYVVIIGQKEESLQSV